MRFFRLLRIFIIIYRYGLDEIAFSSLKSPWIQRLVKVGTVGRSLHEPRAVRVRRALEDLGPIFVKFGQLLSTRRDLIPADLADELAQLQDNVPPFDPDVARREIERGLNRRIEDVFESFERQPVASASIAQVHLAVMKRGPGFGTWAGREVAVKVLRPNMLPVIDNDLALLDTAAILIERLWHDGKRLRPREVVAEFDMILHDELDLMREAANASQLRRNFSSAVGGRAMLRVPEMAWDYCSDSVLVMERVYGVPVSQLERIRAAGVDIKRLSASAVEIFFIQSLRDGFFHADMHPGNIYVGIDRERNGGADFGRWIALDFGIVGTLSDEDKNYLAQNLLAFFRRDYKRVAELHVESGWVPASTRVGDFEAAVRTVCEPIFDRPLREISFGFVLLRLFQISRRFNMEIQPQLVLLQKTLLNIEGLGRQLDPDLDLWQTAKPLLEQWMSEQIGWRALEARFQREAPQWAALVPQLPRILSGALVEGPRANERLSAELRRLRHDHERRSRLLLIGLVLVGALVLMVGWAFIGMPLPGR